MKKICTAFYIVVVCITMELHAQWPLAHYANNAYLWWYDNGHYAFDAEISDAIACNNELFIEQLVERKVSQDVEVPFQKHHLDQVITRKRHIIASAIIQHGNNVIQRYIQGTDKTDSSHSPCYKALSQLNEKDSKKEQQHASFIAGLLMQKRKQYDDTLLAKISQLYKQDDHFAYVARHIPCVDVKQPFLHYSTADYRRYAIYRKDIFSKIFHASSAVLRTDFLKTCTKELQGETQNMSYEEKKLYGGGDYNKLSQIVQKREYGEFIKDLVQKQHEQKSEDPEINALVEQYAQNCRNEISEHYEVWQEVQRDHRHVLLAHKYVDPLLVRVMNYIARGTRSDDIERIAAQPLILSETLDYLAQCSFLKEQFNQGCPICFTHYDECKAVVCCANKHMVCLSCFNNPACVMCPSCRAELSHDNLHVCQKCGDKADVKLVYCKTCEMVSGICASCNQYPCCDAALDSIDERDKNQIKNYIEKAHKAFGEQCNAAIDQKQDQAGARIRALAFTLQEEKIDPLHEACSALEKEIERLDREILQSKTLYEAGYMKFGNTDMKQHFLVAHNDKIRQLNIKINKLNALAQEWEALQQGFHIQVASITFGVQMQVGCIEQLYENKKQHLLKVYGRSIAQEEQ